MQHGRSPTILELADALDITPEDVVHAQEAAKSPHSIHETVFENDGDPITLLDKIADQDTNLFYNIKVLEDIMELNERERLIVYMRYYIYQSQLEFAEQLRYTLSQ